MKLNEDLNKHLEIVEENLVKNIQENFDFFTDAFNNFDEMKADLTSIGEKATAMKNCSNSLKS